MSKKKPKVIRLYGPEAPGAPMSASLSGSSKQRRRVKRMLERWGYSLTHDGGAGRVIATPSDKGPHGAPSHVTSATG